MQLQQVVMPGQVLPWAPVLSSKKRMMAGVMPVMMQTEEIAGITGAHLQAATPGIPLPLLKRRTGLRIYSQNALAQEIVYCCFCIFSACQSG